MKSNRSRTPKTLFPVRAVLEICIKHFDDFPDKNGLHCLKKEKEQMEGSSSPILK